ncbi:MAG: hypothetical protein U5R46_01430 [Gammaproteobacteria bacterium]|nr:hypothetical protein [Gammaproteobacteria bacterium]
MLVNDAEVVRESQMVHIDRAGEVNNDAAMFKHDDGIECSRRFPRRECVSRENIVPFLRLSQHESVLHKRELEQRYKQVPVPKPISRMRCLSTSLRSCCAIIRRSGLSYGAILLSFHKSMHVANNRR